MSLSKTSTVGHRPPRPRPILTGKNQHEIIRSVSVLSRNITSFSKSNWIQNKLKEVAKFYEEMYLYT